LSNSSKLDIIKRKIQLTGKSTYTISLPRDWIDRYHINQGDELNILEQADGTLLVSKETLSIMKEKDLIIDIDKIDDINLLEKIIISKYLAGYSKITIRSRSELESKVRKSISATVSNLSGVEIIHEGDKEIEIRELFIQGEFPLDKLLRRAHLIARNMQVSAINSFNADDIEGAIDVIEREKDVDRLYFLIRREIVSALENPTYLKELDLKPQEVLYIYPVAKSLEKIADHCEGISKNCIQLKGKKIDEATKTYLEKYSQLAIDIHTKAIQAFISKKTDIAFKAIKIFEKLKNQLNDGKLKRSHSNDIETEVNLSDVERHLDRICGYGLDIAEMAIDRIH
jgi:phosphate uptake regulator